MLLASRVVGELTGSTAKLTPAKNGSGSQGAEVGPSDAKTVLAGKAVSGSYARNGGVIYGFVPDGVASVSVDTRTNRSPRTVPVENDMFFVFEPAKQIAAVTGAKTITWRNAAAKPIKTTSPAYSNRERRTA